MSVEDAAESWQVVDSVVEFEGTVLSLRRDTVRRDGDQFEREVVDHPGAVAVFALDEDERVLVVNQYRHPVRARLVEMPAGLLDVADEPPLDAARRELLEEGGVVAERWSELIDVHPSPGFSSELIRVFLAEGISTGEPDPEFRPHHEEAAMTVEWVPLADIVAAALSGRVRNGILVAGSLAIWATRHGNP